MAAAGLIAGALEDALAGAAAGSAGAGAVSWAWLARARGAISKRKRSVLRVGTLYLSCKRADT